MFDSSPFFLEFFLASLPPVLASLAHTHTILLLLLSLFHSSSTFLFSSASFLLLAPSRGLSTDRPNYFYGDVCVCVCVHMHVQQRGEGRERERENNTLGYERVGGREEKRRKEGEEGTQWGRRSSIPFMFVLLFF